MKAKVLCSWCLGEGKSETESFLGWGETTTGRPSHGICRPHSDALCEAYGLDDESASEPSVPKRRIAVLIRRAIVIHCGSCELGRIRYGEPTEAPTTRWDNAVQEAKDEGWVIEFRRETASIYEVSVTCPSCVRKATEKVVQRMTWNPDRKHGC